MSKKKSKWPKGPRYVVGSIDGYKIDPNAGRRTRMPSDQPAPVLWYVNDSAFGYQTLLETFVEHEARLLAARLNHEPLPMPHVSRACKSCDPSDEEILAGQVVVAMRYGIAHLGRDDGTTECGCDATGKGWWWPL